MYIIHRIVYVCEWYLYNSLPFLLDKITNLVNSDRIFKYFGLDIHQLRWRYEMGELEF